MSARAFFGIVLVIIGGGLLLDRAGVIEFGSILATWWPLILIAIAAIQLATRSAPVPGSLIVLAVGLVFLGTTLGLLPGNVWSYLWPIVLVAIGAWLLLARGGWGAREFVDTEDQVNSFIAFGGANPRFESANFRGGSVTALFGGSEVDLTGAGLAPEGAKLDVTAMFGGVEVQVPAGWQVKVSGLPIFGGWDNKTARASEKTPEGPVLNVNCFVAFGGVEVHN